MSPILRLKPRISYYEPEEPDLDQYVFCEKCKDYVYEYCSIHGPLLVIPDNKVPTKPNVPSYVPRAALTIPHVFLHITYSIIPGAGLGVFSTLTLPSGVRFGPYRGQRTNVVDSSYCWQIYDKNRKPSHCVDAADSNKSNWMRYVNCARHWKEQNLVAFQYNGELYYRTIKIIPRFTELMVFYGSEFACELDVDLGKYNSPAGYAQKFGAPVAKKRKPNDDNTTTQIHKNEMLSENAERTDNNLLKTNQGIISTIKDITIETQHGQNMILASKDQKQDKADIKNKQAATKNGESEKKCTTKNKNVTKNNKAKNKSEPKNLESIQRKTFVKNKAITNNNKEVGNTQIEQSKTIDKPNIGIKEYKNNATNNMNELKSNVTCKPTSINELDFYFYCNDCNKKFVSKADLQKHLRFHDPNRAYACDICKLRYITLNELNIHINIHKKLRMYDCKLCSKTFTESGNLKRHMRTHTGEKPYVCQKCNKTFTQSGSLKRHMRTHTGEKPYVCQKCSKTFTHSGHLKSHMRTHTGEKPYVCQKCSKTFTHSGHLKSHMRTHTGEKPYVCQTCFKTFTQSGDLKRHMRTHTGEKPYVCQKCSKTFTHSGHLKRHMRTHTGEKP